MKPAKNIHHFCGLIKSKLSRKPPFHTIINLDLVEEFVTNRGLLYQPKVINRPEEIKVGEHRTSLNCIPSSWPTTSVSWIQFEKSYVSSRSGVCYVPGKRAYFVDFAWGWGNPRSSVKPQFKGVRKTIDSQEPFTMISARASGYHGIIEDLPIVLELIKEFRNLTIGITKENRWVRNFGEFLGIEEDRFLEVDENWVGAKNLVCVTKSAFGEFVNPSLIESIASVCRERVGQSSGTSIKLYISREHAARRSFPGEEKVREQFEANSFTAVSLEALSIREQALLLRDADVIAGFHGAGLLNMIFSPSKISVIELYHSLGVNSCYASLATVLDNYYRILQVPNSFDLNSLSGILNS